MQREKDNRSSRDTVLQGTGHILSFIPVQQQGALCFEPRKLPPWFVGFELELPSIAIADGAMKLANQSRMLLHVFHNALCSFLLEQQNVMANDDGAIPGESESTDGLIDQYRRYNFCSFSDNGECTCRAIPSVDKAIWSAQRYIIGMQSLNGVKISSLSTSVEYRITPHLIVFDARIFRLFPSTTRFCAYFGRHRDEISKIPFYADSIMKMLKDIRRTVSASAKLHPGSNAFTQFLDEVRMWCYGDSLAELERPLQSSLFVAVNVS